MNWLPKTWWCAGKARAPLLPPTPEQHVQYRFLKLLPDTGNASVEGPAQRSVIDCRRVRASADISRVLALRSGNPVMQAKRILSSNHSGRHLATGHVKD